MHVVGLIVEYNPFHNGHRYHLQEARKITGADYCIAVMSGNFVQRGAPAIVNKYIRTHMALQNGIDLVLELPVPFAAGSAETFAGGSIAILHGLGVVDSLCFGSECGELSLFTEAVKVLTEEPTAYRQLLQRYLKCGLTFPAARSQALLDYAGNRFYVDGELLKSPNNILALEYLKALSRLDSAIRPFTIKRHVSQYHSTAFEGEYSSASAIRLSLQNGDTAKLSSQMPQDAFSLLSQSNYLTADDLSQQLSYRLFSLRGRDLTQYADVSPELAARIQKLTVPGSFSETVAAIKTMQYTYTRVSRALLHILLGITSRENQLTGRHGCAAYARVLGFRREAAPLLTEIKKKSRLPLITKTAGLTNPLFQKEVFASDIYRTAYYHKYSEHLKDEYTQGLVLL